MAINNYINLQRNDFCSPYLDGIANLKSAFSPQSKTNINNSAHRIVFIPSSLADRVCHFVSGIGLMIPIVNLVIACALRYFATQNLPGVRSPASAAAVEPPSTSSASNSGQSSLLHSSVVVPAPFVAPQNHTQVPRLAASDVVEARHSSSSASLVESNSLPAAAIFPVIASSTVLPSASAAEPSSTSIASNLGSSSLLDSSAIVSARLDTPQNHRQVLGQASFDVSIAPDPRSSASAMNSDSLTTRLMEVSSPATLVLPASEPREIWSLARILEENEEEGDSDQDSLPSATGSLSRVAGVLPFRDHLGEVEILLGKRRETRDWSCFGGKHREEELSIDHVAYKCEEVTGAFLGKRTDILPHLSESNKIGVLAHIYLMRVENSSITPEQFLQQRKCVEVTDIAWVKIRDLLVVSCHSNNRLKIDGSQGKLDPDFRGTLKASSATLCNKIAEIKSKRKQKSVPLGTVA